jgi:hypothetical protein
MFRAGATRRDGGSTAEHRGRARVRSQTQSEEARMPDETHKLQKDPPEGSREVIEGELARKDKQGGPKRDRSEKSDGENTGER